MCVTDSPKSMLAKEVHPAKASCPMWLTDSPKAMAAKEVHPRKAHSPMWVTDTGIVTKTSWREFWKADGEISVRLQGILTPKHPCVWIFFWLQLLLRSLRMWQSLGIQHPRALLRQVTQHHLWLSRREAAPLWGLCAQLDLDKGAAEGASPSTPEQWLSSEHRGWWHFLVRCPI